MKDLRWTTVLGFILSAMGLLIIIIFSFSNAFNDGSFTLNAELANKFGGFIGGMVGPIFSLAGFFLLYETIQAQRTSFDSQQNAFNAQQSNFRIQQFEAKFFELVRIHRDNVSQMVHRVPWDSGRNYYEKANVFIEIKSQFSKLLKSVKSKVDDSATVAIRDKEKTALNIAYLILFFGTSKATRSDLEHFLRKYGYDRGLIDSIVTGLYSEKTAYNPKTVYYGGHQVRLGHYFRHLFQAVKFVDNAEFLDHKQKYEYVKTLRAQLTQHELAIFFLNSLSLGQEWEKNGYITTYKMIKNLPKNFIATELNPKNYYGKFKYEWEK